MNDNKQTYTDLCSGSTNRGVTNTDEINLSLGISGLIATLDWMEFTVWNDSVQEVAETILGLSAKDFFHSELYANGYRDSYLYLGNHNIIIATNGIQEQGMHVTITGQGCQLLFSMQSPNILIERILEHWGKFSRVDLALDDYTTQWYSVSALIKHLQQNEIICRWKTYHVYQGGNIASVASAEESLYLGSAKSDYSLKVYNKTLEQKKKLQGTEAVNTIPEQWTRWEFCCRHKKAHILMQLLCKKQFAFGEVFAGLLCDCMRICKSDGSKNRSRWPVQKKWQKFIGNVEPLALHVEKKQSTLDDKRHWLERQVSPTLAAVLKTKDGFARVLEMTAKADISLNQKFVGLVEAYNEQVKDDETVKNLVQKSCVPYVLDLTDRCFLEGPPPDESA